MPKKKRAVWNGPEEDGITQSLLSRFLVCRERFRLLVVEGLATADAFNHNIEYGNMWHACEEALAAGEDWEDPLLATCMELSKRYKAQSENVQHWWRVCKTQFPIYVKYWEKNPDVKKRVPLLQEEVFKVPYELPSGRTVQLRGKWDSVDLIGPKRSQGIYLQENKTKGNIVELQMQKQLQFDLQTMIYLIALQNTISGQNPILDAGGKKVLGVRYNVVRRPLSGGLGSIRQRKPTKSNPMGESDDEFYGRLGDIISLDPGPENFFMRWKVEITEQDIERFKVEFLTPVLEQLCNWWDWVSSPEGLDDPFQYLPHTGSAQSWIHHWRHPYGVWHPLNQGLSTDMDEYLATGSELGLERVNQLFPELT